MLICAEYDTGSLLSAYNGKRMVQRDGLNVNLCGI